MAKFRLLAVGAAVSFLGSVIHVFQGHNLFAGGCLVIAAAVGGYLVRTYPHL